MSALCWALLEMWGTEQWTKQTKPTLGETMSSGRGGAINKRGRHKGCWCDKCCGQMPRMGREAGWRWTGRAAASLINKVIREEFPEKAASEWELVEMGRALGLREQAVCYFPSGSGKCRQVRLLCQVTWHWIRLSEKGTQVSPVSLPPPSSLLEQKLLGGCVSLALN